MSSITTGYEWWEYFLIPWIAGIVGYATNVMALQMMFYPINFWGIELFRLKDEPWGFFGWQGVIPTKCHKMASITFDLMTNKLISIKDIFNKLNPIEFAHVMEDGLLLLMDNIINEVATEEFPTLWNETLPQNVKDDLIITMHQESSKFLEDFMIDMKDNIEKVVDIKQMCVNACVANKPLVNKIFMEVGDKEFQLIRRSGAYFGFLFGCIQMGIWFFYDGSWILPVAGFLVGWITNYLALKVIFRPINPKQLLPRWLFCFLIPEKKLQFQGLFLKRQKEVSESYSRVVCVEILHVKAMWDAILTGPLSKNFYAMLRAHTLIFTDRLIDEIKPLVVVSVGSSKLNIIKESIASKVIKKLPDIIDLSYEYTNFVLDMENEICSKMKELSSAEFEGVLHPAFEEDEILLIIVGGILGAIVGILELFFLF